MKTTVLTILIALFIVTMPSFISSQELSDAREIVSRNQENLKLKGSESVARLLIYDQKGRLRERNIAMISAQSQDSTINNTLMRFLSPADVKGTGFLIKDYTDKDDDMWVFLPSLRKSRRIVSSEKSGNFMGSELTYSDISQFTIADFNFELIGSETVANVDCYVINQIPNNPNIASDYGFSKKTLYIGKEDIMLRQAITWNFKNKKWKIITVPVLKTIPGLPNRKRNAHIVVENLENNRRSELIVDQFAYNENVKQEYFTIPYLERF